MPKFPFRKKWHLTAGALLVALLALGVVAIYMLLGADDTEHKIPAHREKAVGLIHALEANKITKATSFDQADESNAQYYALLAQQMGKRYALVTTHEKHSKASNEYSFIFSTDKPERPSARFIRVITVKRGDTIVVKSVFPTPTRPSPFPADTRT